MNGIDATKHPNAETALRAQEQRRATLLAELIAEQQTLADCETALDDLAQSTDHEATDARGMWLRLRTRALEAIDDIEEALARLDEGTSESCVRCGDRIGQARLDALPRTKVCIVCASVMNLSRVSS